MLGLQKGMDLFPALSPGRPHSTNSRPGGRGSEESLSVSEGTVGWLSRFAATVPVLTGSPGETDPITVGHEGRVME